MTDISMLRRGPARYAACCVLAVAACALLLVACGSSSSSSGGSTSAAQTTTPQRGGTLVVTYQGEPQTLDPAIDFEGNGWAIEHAIFGTFRRARSAVLGIPVDRRKEERFERGDVVLEGEHIVAQLLARVVVKLGAARLELVRDVGQRATRLGHQPTQPAEQVSGLQVVRSLKVRPAGGRELGLLALVDREVDVNGGHVVAAELLTGLSHTTASPSSRRDDSAQAGRLVTASQVRESRGRRTVGSPPQRPEWADTRVGGSSPSGRAGSPRTSRGGAVEPCVADLGQRVADIEVGVETASHDCLQLVEVLDLGAGPAVLGIGAAHEGDVSLGRAPGRSRERGGGLVLLRYLSPAPQNFVTTATYDLCNS